MNELVELYTDCVDDNLCGSLGGLFRRVSCRGSLYFHFVFHCLAGVSLLLLVLSGVVFGQGISPARRHPRAQVILEGSGSTFLEGTRHDPGLASNFREEPRKLELL